MMSTERVFRRGLVIVALAALGLGLAMWGLGHAAAACRIWTLGTIPVAAGLAAMECVVVQDLFLNETANYAHVFLPGSTFLEKDGTFINAECRIGRVRKVTPEKRHG